MAEVTTTDLSAADKRQIVSYRRTVATLASAYGGFRERAAELAPKIIKLFKALAAKHDDLTFVGFTRLFDASIPLHADDKNGEEGYKKHRTYYTLDYMRRVATPRVRGVQGVRDPATDQLARMLATILQTVKDDAVVWTAAQKEFRLSDRATARLQTRVAAAKPLITIRMQANVSDDSIVHVEPIKGVKTVGGGKVETGEDEDLARPRRRVRMAA